MPAPQASQLAELTKMNFSGKQIALPVNWQQPNDQFSDAFASEDLSVAPNPGASLFHEPTLNRCHVDSAKQLSDGLAAFIDGICNGICGGLDQWLKAAVVAGVVIAGPVGTVVPGSVQGPPLGPLIVPLSPTDTPQKAKYSNAIANALGTLWHAWHLAITGVLQYPVLAAVPAPVAPPAPNVPVPLATLPSSAEAGLAPASLKGAMEAQLADPDAVHAPELFDSLAQAFHTVFQPFKTTTMVQNVMGAGPVPTFAPPFVPAGPVVGGVGNGAPGCLQ